MEKRGGLSMKWHKKCFFILLFIWLDVKELPGNIKRWVWNKHILLWWYGLWIRKDEFHISLNMDTEAMRGMNDKELFRYRDDLIRRRTLAELASNRREFGEA
jgi:hypothetical protein